jgi:hypothetical protein
MQDHALLMHNVFVDIAAMAIGSQAAYLDVIGNIVEGSATGVQHEFIQMGRVSCNVFAQMDDRGSRVPIGEQGNLTVDAAFVDTANGDYRPTACADRGHQGLPRASRSRRSSPGPALTRARSAACSGAGPPRRARGHGPRRCARTRAERAG